MNEVWKDIPGYEGYYQASNFGRIKRLERTFYKDNGKSKTAKYTLSERIKDIQKQTQGYSQVVLYKDGIGKTFRLNTLIARMFIQNHDNRPFVNHIDGNKDNNRVDNLEWCTASENIKHAYDLNLLVHYARPVLQMNKNGNSIALHKSGKDAAVACNGSKSGICSACKNGTEYKGFRWKYNEPR